MSDLESVRSDDDDRRRAQGDQLGQEIGDPLEPAVRIPHIDGNDLAVDVAEVVQTLAKCSQHLWQSAGTHPQYTDVHWPIIGGPRGPGCHRESYRQGAHERPPVDHSITKFARAKRPPARATTTRVLRTRGLGVEVRGASVTIHSFEASESAAV